MVVVNVLRARGVRLLSVTRAASVGMPGVTRPDKDAQQETQFHDSTLQQTNGAENGASYQARKMQKSEDGPFTPDGASNGGFAGGMGHVAAKNEQEAMQQMSTANQYGRATPAQKGENGHGPRG
ncbi:hypothetical protein EXIGLDRAFT_764739 [Exidia glandulosa HHB12029]|uniref:Uncharacterized protein n=1 Tax=Exidia glandulosa HHB12029 TaxID=1314781 RepID=A0A165KZX6_EXIGL|nr:hypothetical protein EXIGLDRAFT_764739 [Exidia glandulosa HHB12029]